MRSAVVSNHVVIALAASWPPSELLESVDSKICFAIVLAAFGWPDVASDLAVGILVVLAVAELTFGGLCLENALGHRHVRLWAAGRRQRPRWVCSGGLVVNEKIFGVL